MIEAIVIWGVIWFMVAGVSTWVFGVIGAIIGGYLTKDGEFVGGPIGIVAGLLVAAFAVIQVVLHVVALIQALT